MTVMISNARRPSIPRMSIPRYDQWRRDRLAEARSVLADVADHPDTLIILAARVVCRHTDDPAECADASDLRRLLERGSVQAVTAATLQNGGAA